MRVLFFFVKHLLHHLVKWIDLRLTIAIGSVNALLKLFLHPPFTEIVSDQLGTICTWDHIRLVAFIYGLLNPPPPSVVDTLRIKQSVASRLCYFVALKRFNTTKIDNYAIVNMESIGANFSFL